MRGVLPWFVSLGSSCRVQKIFFPALAALVCQVKNCVFLTIYYFPVTGSKPCRQLCSVACLFICVSGTNQVGPPIITLINGLTRVYPNLPHSGGSSLTRRSLCRSCQCFFVLSSMKSHPGSQYENRRKGNKEDTAFIKLASSHVTSEKLAKKCKNDVSKRVREGPSCPPPPKKKHSQELASFLEYVAFSNFAFFWI